MKKFLLLMGVLFKITILFSQSLMDNKPIGIFFDINNLPILNYLDYDYQPKEFLSIDFNIGEEFTNGYYFDLNGKKIPARIKRIAGSRNIEVESKSDTIPSREKISAIIKRVVEGESRSEISPDQCLGYVLGKDSFAVIQDFKVERDLGAFKHKDKEFAEVLIKVGDVTFFKYTVNGFNSLTAYLAKFDNTNEYISFPKDPIEFKRTALKLFGKFILLQRGILNEKYKYYKVYEMAKLLDYWNKMKNNERIYFLKYFSESTQSNFDFYGKIVNLKDSIWTVSYYSKSDDSLFTGQFSSFIPLRKQGDFTWFYPNGKIRKKMTFKDDELIGDIKVYYPNGKLHYNYKIKRNNLYFTEVSDSSGVSLINMDGKGEETIFDNVEEKRIKIIYDSHKIIKAYYQNSAQQTIYLHTNNNAGLRSLNIIQEKLNEQCKLSDNVVKDNTQGMLLVKFTIDELTNVLDVEIVRNIHNSCDIMIKDVLKDLCSSKWNAGVANRNKIIQEIVVPVFINVNSSVKERRTNYYYDPFFHQRMMLMNPPKFNMPAMTAPRF